MCNMTMRFSISKMEGAPDVSILTLGLVFTTIDFPIRYSMLKT